MYNDLRILRGIDPGGDRSCTGEKAFTILINNEQDSVRRSGVSPIDKIVAEPSISKWTTLLEIFFFTSVAPHPAAECPLIRVDDQVAAMESQVSRQTVEGFGSDGLLPSVDDMVTTFCWQSLTSKRPRCITSVMYFIDLARFKIDWR